MRSLIPTPAVVVSPGWADQFTPYGAFHAVSVGVCLVVIALWIWRGRVLLARDRDDGGARERRFRLTVGWAIVAFQIFGTVWRLLPQNFSYDDSLPLHLCRLVGWIAPIALMTHWRRPRTLLYFWGFGLGTQAFATPMWPDGLASVEYWLYWLGHTAIVGAAVYEIVVHGWGPRFREWGFAALWGLIYAGLVIPVNLWLGTNYSYLGRGDYGAPSIVDAFGPWPDRVWFIVFGGELMILLLYWFAIAVRRIKQRRATRPASEVS